jgi:hypothetical protein
MRMGIEEKSYEMVNGCQCCVPTKKSYTSQNKTTYDDISPKTSGESIRNIAVPKLQKYGNIYNQ